MAHRNRSLTHQIERSSRCVAALLALEGAAALLIGGLRADHAAVATPAGVLALALAGGVVVLPALVRRRPAWAAAALGAALLANLALGLVVVGVPDLHVALQVAFGALCYGGQAFLAVSAFCAASVLPAHAASPRRRRRRSAPALRRAA